MAAGLLSSGAAWAEGWPLAADWEAVPYLDGPAWDACGDVSGSDGWDIVGDDAGPAAAVYDDGTALWFQLRLAVAPFVVSGGDKVRSWRSEGWGVLIETDWDATEATYDFLVLVDGQAGQVVLLENEVAGDDFASDASEMACASYDAPLAAVGSPEVQAAGYALSALRVCGKDGEDEYLLEWKIPWSELTAWSGATRLEELGLLFGTSSSGGRLNKDIAVCDGRKERCADYWALLSRYDADGDGLDNVEEAGEYGTDPLEVDTDGGGLADGDEVAGGTDPLDPSDDTPPDVVISGAVVEAPPPVGRYYGGCLLASRASVLVLLGVGLAGAGLRRRAAPL